MLFIFSLVWLLLCGDLGSTVGLNESGRQMPGGGDGQALNCPRHYFKGTFNQHTSH